MVSLLPKGDFLTVKKQITLDRFRIFSAILIIAIHTYPLDTINPTLDFIFTHIFCRIGVPFFLMISGYFILPQALKDKKVLVHYTIKIIKLYLFCILLYLPIHLYAGSFVNSNILTIIKDILINGTFYHLWYFPALIMGIWITFGMIKYFKKPYILLLLFYIIGLLGDSYYGITEKWIFTKNIYDVIFHIFDYSRNGLFYVPLFLYLGYVIKQIKWKMSKKTSLWLFCTSLFLMILEGLLLHHFHLQRHDSMYIMLIPTMIFLFYFIQKDNKENHPFLRNIATSIYIFHPIFIIFVRGISKLTHLESLFIENSYMHYLLVVITTVSFSVILENIKKKVGKNDEKRLKKKPSLDRN